MVVIERFDLEDKEENGVETHIFVWSFGWSFAIITQFFKIVKVVNMSTPV